MNRPLHRRKQKQKQRLYNTYPRLLQYYIADGRNHLSHLSTYELIDQDTSLNIQAKVNKLY